MSKNELTKVNTNDEREYLQKMVALQKEGKIDRYELLKRFSEYKLEKE